jgi:transposase-like protein
MSKKRRQHSAQYKFQIALEAARAEKTVSQIASEHNIHPNQVSQWKRQLLESGPEVFSHKRVRQEREQEEREAELYEQIGRLRMELEWLKKKMAPFG